MAASLAVEWAKSGVRVNTLRLVAASLVDEQDLMHAVQQSRLYAHKAYQGSIEG
jgi:NAD(P)-dependent dehydrogenase (short-subunit alcohol dehydrogenase family)